MTDAQRCRKNGWKPGTLLAGDEGYGVTVIRITAVGEEGILARAVSHDGVSMTRREAPWTLRCRNWRKAARRSAAKKGRNE